MKSHLGMGSHQSSRMLKDEWLTPPDLKMKFGHFDLDPCAAVNQPWGTAETHFTIHDDGLSKQWHGRVWLNPPYGLKSSKWLSRLADHGNGIALIFARTETDMFFRQVWGRADALLFLRGRLHFHHVDGSRAKANAGAPSVLIAYGDDNVASLGGSANLGKFINLM